MEFRQLGSAGLRVPALSFGTATFGGGSETRPSYPYWHSVSTRD
jgi:aryl-alcohol dehydrogenase-like predicted oxidoreductase